MLYYLVATLYVLACFLLLLVVLLQQGKGGDIASAFGGGGSQTAFGARGGATVLTRATAVLGALFMIGAVVLAVIGKPGAGSLMRGTARNPPTDVEKVALAFVGMPTYRGAVDLLVEISKEGGVAHFQALDVTSLEDTQKFVAFGRDAHGRIDVLINNAGVMPLSPLAALKVNEWNQMIDVNIRGVLHGIAAVLPDMKKQGSGQIINLSSIGGHVVVATGAVYCATKFAVIAIPEGLRQENTDIRVTVISPGVTTSELADTISHADTAKVMEGFRSVAIPAEAIARAIAYAIEQPDDVDVSEIIVRPTASPY